MDTKQRNEAIKEKYQNLIRLDGYVFRVYVAVNGDRIVGVQTRKAVMFERGASYKEVYRGDEAGVVKFIKGYAESQKPAPKKKSTKETGKASGSVLKFRQRVKLHRMKKANKGSYNSASHIQLTRFYDYHGISREALSQFCQIVSPVNAKPEELNSKAMWALRDAMTDPDGYRLVHDVLRDGS